MSELRLEKAKLLSDFRELPASASVVLSVLRPGSENRAKSWFPAASAQAARMLITREELLPQRCGTISRNTCRTNCIHGRQVTMTSAEKASVETCT